MYSVLSVISGTNEMSSNVASATEQTIARCQELELIRGLRNSIAKLAR
jgi:hypothetical protein